MIGIVDYGSGNVGAVANIYHRLKIPHLVTGDLQELEAADRYVLPGVGAFDATMRNLHELGIVEMLNEQVLVKKKKILGICVGMHILADASEEGSLPGLGWISARVRKIDDRVLTSAPKLPHMGWNSVKPSRSTELLNGIDANQGFYFLHSYYLDVVDESDVVATVSYGKELPCVVTHGNVFGMQCHPEKSHKNGTVIFQNFSEL